MVIEYNRKHDNMQDTTIKGRTMLYISRNILFIFRISAHQYPGAHLAENLVVISLWLISKEILPYDCNAVDLLKDNYTFILFKIRMRSFRRHI